MKASLLTKKNMHLVEVFVGRVLSKSGPLLKRLERMTDKWLRRFGVM